MKRCREAWPRIQPRLPALRCTRLAARPIFSRARSSTGCTRTSDSIRELEFLTGSTGANDPGHIQFRGGRGSQSTLEASKASATTTGEPPTGEEREKLLEKQKEINLELDKAKQKLLDIKTEEAGGTETSKTKLAIDEADAKQKGDAVENAKKLQAAAEADLANAEKTGATQERLTKLKTEVAKATEAVTTAEEKQAESTARLEVAKAKAAGDTEKEKAAELAVADLKIKAAGADVAARQAAEAEKLSIETRYAEQSKSLALEKANEEVAAVRTAAQNKIKDIDLEAKAKQISESQKVALTKAALAEEIAAEKSIYEQELALDNLRPAERQKILAQLQAAEEQYAQKMKETQLKAAEDSAKAWQSMADKVAGVLNSQVSGVISGTTSVKQAFSNMAKSMIEDAAKYAVKWAVEHAFAATQVMAQNTAVTTSALAGQAAQDAAKTTSGAAGVASQAANAVQSIAIDGAKTFGGVFGFLAPLLGPFAAGPAAGAQATVLAAGAAFDTGAWSLAPRHDRRGSSGRDGHPLARRSRGRVPQLHVGRRLQPRRHRGRDLPGRRPQRLSQPLDPLPRQRDRRAERGLVLQQQPQAHHDGRRQGREARQRLGAKDVHPMRERPR